MNKSYTHRPFLVNLLLAVYLFLGLTGIMGGLNFMLDPSGTSIGASVSWLEKTPINNFLLPGIFLFLVMGLVPLALTYATWTNRSWAWPTGITIGAALACWILVLFLMLPTTLGLQYTYLGVGLLIILINITRPVFRYFSS